MGADLCKGRGLVSKGITGVDTNVMMEVILIVFLETFLNYCEKQL